MRNNAKYPVKDERDQQIDTAARSHALDFLVAATQVLTVLCVVKGNPAWKGSLSLLFLGVAAMLFYKYSQYKARPYRQVGVVLGLIGLALLIWFGIAG